MIPQTPAEWEDEIRPAFAEALNQMVGDEEEEFAARFEHEPGHWGLFLIGTGAKLAVAARGMTGKIASMTLHLGSVAAEYTAMAEEEPARFRDNPPLIPILFVRGMKVVS